ncbi:hypothetical protein KaCgl_10710 [Corynebacterium glutamicum]|nr:hypothetical protein KaCgl_10710 [Corynebacterium glutamicum]
MRKSASLSHWMHCFGDTDKYSSPQWIGHRQAMLIPIGFQDSHVMPGGLFDYGNKVAQRHYSQPVFVPKIFGGDSRLNIRRYVHYRSGIAWSSK